MKSLINPTLPLESEFYASHVFFTVGSELYGQGGTKFTSNEPPSIPQIASFDWDSLVEPPFPSAAPF